MTQLISQAAVDLIVAEEVSSRADYDRQYRHPEWPGGASGVTIGIGYDVGYCDSKAQLAKDWEGLLPADTISLLERCVGVHGERASILLSSVRNRVDVPWDTAMKVFMNVDVPRWYDRCKHHLPNFEELSLDCKGALVSLAYNRGTSFSEPEEDDPHGRTREMRAIKQYMIERKFDLIPAEFTKMKRLWDGKGLDGLLARRDKEAAMFKRGLTAPTSKPEPTATETAGWAAGIGAAVFGVLGYIGDRPLLALGVAFCAAVAFTLIHRHNKRKTAPKPE